jgi:hypothetical protein
MPGEALLTSNHAPEELYNNFEDFLARHKNMRRINQQGHCAMLFMLVRLVLDNNKKGRRVFDWAVKRICIDMLRNIDPVSNLKRFPGIEVKEISPAGLEWLERAEERLSGKPVEALQIVEGVFLLEKLAAWAEERFANEFRGEGYTFLEFRKRPQNNEDTSAKIDWLDALYADAQQAARQEGMDFVCRRDCAIALAITALAGGQVPVDQEIDEAMGDMFPSYKSLEKHAPTAALVSKKIAVEWLLGKAPEREVAF